jgi:hypothetical protein
MSYDYPILQGYSDTKPNEIRLSSTERPLRVLTANKKMTDFVDAEDTRGITPEEATRMMSIFTLLRDFVGRANPSLVTPRQYSGPQPMLRGFIEPKYNVVGEYRSSDRGVYLAPRDSTGLFETTIHELGHDLGYGEDYGNNPDPNMANFVARYLTALQKNKTSANPAARLLQLLGGDYRDFELANEAGNARSSAKRLQEKRP